ncbi:S-DNA-T family DNA segregation ATPase FtsK/SpoIIIE [Sphingomonas sp. BE270]|jgi:S-DNA-T family DNA segregation ATPase FtsK/SpoIIIE|nr:MULTISPECIES: DNA translocase FtsK 4TM domain-containing protein [unclassified Sphingomonas]MDR6848219.1 S-DNA-T family DNA segregation ATPase FtsK/SpoIIIE [Sphingomonas sp. BE137]MDR7258881.1 S-DNA-T family DNA segregation ATPase FtsK/SpoIIIE [Sphingomonas sp. BE270]
MASRAQPPLWRETVRAGAVRSGALIAAIALVTLVVVIVIALASYHASDPSLNTASAGPARNWLGRGGALVADGAFWLLGPGIALLLPTLLLIALRLWRDVPVGRWRRILLTAAGGIALLGSAFALVSGAAVGWLPAGWGGILGLAVSDLLRAAIALIGNSEAVLWTTRGAAAIVGLCGLALWAYSFTIDMAERPARAPREPKRLTDRRGAAEIEPERFVPESPRKLSMPRAVATPDVRPGPVISERQMTPVTTAKPREKQTSMDFGDKSHLPSVDLLKPTPPSVGGPIDKVALDRNARLLETVLSDFHVKGSIINVRPGPVVTMYELEPAAGIKASRVIQLADDIARNMSAVSARVATIPGRTVIGIELPNARRETVGLRELIDSLDDQPGALSLVLGKNIAGDPVIADLAPMPHLLVAGTTGSGKSVGLNCMILSLLYRLKPEECRMIMIDPKMLELSMYEDIPHLYAPVVTDPAKAVRALKWTVEQMEDRYRQMSSLGVRSLASFNDKVRAAKAKGQPLGRKVQTGYEPVTGAPIYEEETLDYQVLPQIVVIVDELADLMMTAGKEVEFLIQRLAQKARAAGIHLIMATQRPSVDVITGVIKANLPTRISFHVTSKIDSRTILGEQGAEQLLGKGDMLYMPGGKGIVRVHGPFVSDDEVRAVADHWRAQGRPDYNTAVTEEPEDGFALDGAPIGEDSAEDQQYRAAVQLVVESQKASTSWLQRQLRVGYNSAARLIERMEKDNIVGRPDHVGRREVLRDRDGHPV